jgi:hypothetical protein
MIMARRQSPPIMQGIVKHRARDNRNTRGRSIESQLPKESKAEASRVHVVEPSFDPP